jgi:hypothetical protein
MNLYQLQLGVDVSGVHVLDSYGDDMWLDKQPMWIQWVHTPIGHCALLYASFSLVACQLVKQYWSVSISANVTIYIPQRLIFRPTGPTVKGYCKCHHLPLPTITFLCQT